MACGYDVDTFRNQDWTGLRDLGAREREKLWESYKTTIDRLVAPITLAVRLPQAETSGNLPRLRLNGHESGRSSSSSPPAVGAFSPQVT